MADDRLGWKPTQSRTEQPKCQKGGHELQADFPFDSYRNAHSEPSRGAMEPVSIYQPGTTRQSRTFHGTLRAAHHSTKKINPCQNPTETFVVPFLLRRTKNAVLDEFTPENGDHPGRGTQRSGNGPVRVVTPRGGNDTGRRDKRGPIKDYRGNHSPTVSRL